MTKLEEMEAVALALREDCDEIKLQLDHAKSNAAAGGEYADATWFSKARHALRCKSREYQTMLLEMGKLRKEHRRERNDARERAFIKVCRRRLDPEVYKNYWAEVDDLEEDGLL